MGKHTLDTVLSIGGDLLAPFTGGLSAAIGNGIAGVDEAAHGNALGAILSLVGAGSGLASGGSSFLGNAAGNVADSALGASGASSGVADLASNLVRGVGSAVQDVGVSAAAPAVLDPILQRTLGISQGGGTPPPTTSIAPTSKSGTGGGAGPSAGPGGLNVTGGTAPQIYPYTKQSSGGASIGAPSAQQQPKGI